MTFAERKKAFKERRKLVSWPWNKLTTKDVIFNILLRFRDINYPIRFKFRGHKCLQNSRVTSFCEIYESYTDEFDF